ncbi:MAG: hypothetical protein GY869_27120, partial [Planctomycetes bacterium]|nr:hypothetical protein [Planctomycetota bacterium]
MISQALQANNRNFNQNRRNSFLEMRRGDYGNCIRKHYHRRFQVEQEYQAYLELDSVIENVIGIRRAEVYGIECHQNLIDVEFIDGPTLAEDFLERGVSALEARIDCLLSLFYEARKQQVQFDSDPSNLIYDRRSDTLVLIDPVCEKMDIADYSMIVFLWGMVKCFFRAQSFAQVVRAQGFAQVVGFRRIWQDINWKYQEACDVSPSEM